MALNFSSLQTYINLKFLILQKWRKKFTMTNLFLRMRELWLAVKNKRRGIKQGNTEIIVKEKKIAMTKKLP